MAAVRMLCFLAFLGLSYAREGPAFITFEDADEQRAELEQLEVTSERVRQMDEAAGEEAMEELAVKPQWYNTPGWWRRLQEVAVVPEDGGVVMEEGMHMARRLLRSQDEKLPAANKGSDSSKPWRGGVTGFDEDFPTSWEGFGKKNLDIVTGIQRSIESLPSKIAALREELHNLYHSGSSGAEDFPLLTVDPQ